MAEVTARKRGTKWECRFEMASIEGKRKQYSKGGFQTKKEALKAGAEAYAKYNRAGSVFEPKQMSISDLLDYYLENYVKKNLSKNAYKTYERLARRQIKPTLGKYNFSTAEKEIFIKFFNSLADKHTLKTIKTIKVVLNGAYNLAISLDWIEYSPLDRVQVPKNAKKSKKKQPLTMEEYEKMIAKIGEDSDYYVPIQIGWFTGMRIGEVLALTWDDVDLDNGIIHARKQIIEKEVSRLKTAASARDIRIGATLRHVLLAERNKQNINREIYGSLYITYTVIKDIVTTGPHDDFDFVCRRPNGKAIVRASLQWKCARMAEYIGKPFSFHAMRHSHATLLIEAGSTVKAVQTRLGHSRAETTMEIYSHVTKSQETEAVELFEKIAHGK